MAFWLLSTGILSKEVGIASFTEKRFFISLMILILFSSFIELLLNSPNTVKGSMSTILFPLSRVGILMFVFMYMALTFSIRVVRLSLYDNSFAANSL